MAECVEVIYRGHVQGVCFRMTAVQKAKDLEVHGTVENLNDGSVKLVVEGLSADIETLLERISRAFEGNIDDIQRRSVDPIYRTGGLRITG